MKWFLGRFTYAFQGLKASIKDKSIFLQACFGILVLFFGFLFRCSLQEWILLFWSIGLVLFAEIVNSCIEGCVDYISLKKDPRAKKIKDMAAFGVLVISICAAFTGLYVFIPKLF